MNGKDILMGLSDISDELVEEAETRHPKKPFPLKHWLALAACLCLIVGLGSLFAPGFFGAAAMDSAAPENGMAMETMAESPLFNRPESEAVEIDRNTSLSRQEPAEALTDFGIHLLQNIPANGQNTLVSPLSVIYALGMTANGARGETLAQMENTLGVPAEALNEWLLQYTRQLSQEDGSRLLPANGIWYRSSCFTPGEAFLEINRKYYQAEIHGSDFGPETLAQVNNWVSEKTLGMIPSILDQIQPEDMMYLINALAFEGEWEVPYTELDVGSGNFHTETGLTRQVEFLRGKEHAYLQGEQFTGFIKYYTDRRYAFVALLPNEGSSVEDLVALLNGQELRQLLANPEYVSVYTSIPKFKAETTLELTPVLKNMGMELPFEAGKADFSLMGSSAANENPHISRIVHKTFLQLDELGTRAGAATAVMMNTTGLITDYKTVDLDRPFVYMLVDCEQQLPFFIGCLMDPEA